MYIYNPQAPITNEIKNNFGKLKKFVLFFLIFCILFLIKAYFYNLLLTPFPSDLLQEIKQNFFLFLSKANSIHP